MINLFKRLFKKKRKEKELTKNQKKLMEDYEKGKVLQIDNKIDNKKYLQNLQKK